MIQWLDKIFEGRGQLFFFLAMDSYGSKYFYMENTIWKIS